MRWKLSAKPEPGVGEYTRMLWPATISTSIGQLTVYVDSAFTWGLNSGAWTAIVNSNRLVQLPLGVLLTAMLVPILPRFSDHVAGERIDDLKAEFRRGLRILWFFSLPIAALLIAIPKPILSLLFRSRQFTDADIQLFSVALVWLAPSILFYVGRDLITRVFYAYKDSTTPYRVGMCAIVIKGLLDWLLVGPLGVGGISLSTTLVTIFNLSALSWLLRAKIGNLGASKLIQPLLIMLLGSVLGAASAISVQASIMELNLSTGQELALHIPTSMIHRLHLGISIGISSALAIGIYVFVCVVCKLEEPHEALKRLRRRKSVPKT
jgi:putative peptidoglycan lipid II flippase